MKQMIVFGLFFLVQSQFGIAQGKWPDKAVCKGNEVEIGDDGNSKYCYTWNSIPDDPTVLKLTDPKIKIKPSRTAIYTRTSVDSFFNKGETHEVKVYSLQDIKLKKVTFSENKNIRKDDNSGFFTEPHWEEGNEIPAPVCFTSGTTMILKATIELDQDIGTEITMKIRGKGTGDIDLPPISIVSSGKSVEFPETAVNKAFPEEQVDFMDPFEMQWEISFDDEKTWCIVDTSKNPLYVLWKEPVSGMELFYTVVHLGSKNAKGKSSETDIFNDVWSEFKDRNVKRVDGKKMTYYNDYRTTNVGTAQILTDKDMNSTSKNGDGQCSSWAGLMLDVLKAQGIHQTGWYVKVCSNTSDGFFVNGWYFHGEGSRGKLNEYPYLNYKVSSAPPEKNSYNWYAPEVTDAWGIPGQGNQNPASIFENHQFIKFGTRFYDPSYGTEGTSIADMEAKGIAAVFKVDVTKIIVESQVGVDFNGDGDKNDIFVPYYIKKKYLFSELVPKYFEY